MRTAAVIAYFHTQVAVAKALGIRQSSVAGWGEFPPPLRQLQLHRITRGRLKAETHEALYAKATAVYSQASERARANRDKVQTVASSE